MAFEIYLNFDNGQALAALETYERVFHGQREAGIFRYKDAPDASYDKKYENYIMHADMKLDNIVLNVSDVMEKAYVKGSQVSILYTCDSTEEVERVFHELSKGGNVRVKPEKTFYAESYADLTDKFGIPWQLIYFKK